ncbi:hypothetical protein BJX65DRAFT_310424 [Aspergillus insuetus]
MRNLWKVFLIFPAAVAADIAVNHKAPGDAGAPVLHPFVSFSIELAFFPDFAGNKTHPNHFSNQLLENLEKLQGKKPYIRVGGNTQDYALFDPDLKVATNGTIIPSISTDWPRILYIGPSFFESYSTWPGTKFIHGFNLGKNSTEDLKLLLDTVPLACEALQDGKLANWELGNEPDLFRTSGNGIVRPGNWTEQAYVNEWQTKVEMLTQKMREYCPQLAEKKWMAPSFAGVTNSLNPVVTWREGLNAKRNIALNSEHNYIGGATQPGVTLQKTLMNHTMTVQSVAKHVNVSRILNEENLAAGIPYILGEMNSLYRQGAPGLSNSFGAALWGVDFNLYCASQNIRRSHMHQGTNYRYSSWQPVETNDTTLGTKAPYYGNVMVAAMLRGEDNVQVANIPLDKDTEAAYAVYVNGNLARIAVINMVEFNYTTPNAHSDQTPARPVSKYSFRLSSSAPPRISVQRLMANGSNAVSGITWDGWSYNYELDKGKPVRLHNVTVGEVAVTDNSVVEIDVPHSSAVILDLQQP